MIDQTLVERVASAEASAESAFQTIDRDRLNLLTWDHTEYDRAIDLGEQWAADERLDKSIRAAGRIRRRDVFALMPALIASQAWDQALVTVNAWGYGRRVGYGQHRTNHILGQSNFAQAAATAAVLVADGRTTEAYFHLNNRTAGHVAGWGPAFFTKFLYFTDPRSGGRALILDAVIARALNTLLPGLRLPDTGWRTPQYAYYLTVMSLIAADRGVSTGLAESTLFQFGRTLKSGGPHRRDRRRPPSAR